MSTDNYSKVEIAGVEYKFDKKAATIIEEYLEKLDLEYKRNQDVLHGYRERISEQLFPKRDEVITEEDVKPILEKLGKFEEVKAELPVEKPVRNLKTGLRSFFKFIGYFVFWLPHIFWLFSVCMASVFMFGSILRGPEDLTLSNVLTYAGFFLLPLVGSIVGIYLTIKKRLKTLLLILFAVEIPLFLISGFRMFLVPVISPVIGFGYFLILFACATLIIDELRIKFIERIKIIEYIKVVGYTVGSFMSGYVFAVWAFFFPVFLISMLEAIKEMFKYLFTFNPYNSSSVGFASPFSFLISGPILLLLIVLFLSPLYVFPIYLGRLIRKIKSLFSVREFIEQIKNNKFKITSRVTGVVTKSIVSLFTLLFVVFGIWVFSDRANKKYAKDLENLNIANFANFAQEKEYYAKFYKNELGYLNEINHKYFAIYRFIVDERSDDTLKQAYNSLPYNYRYIKPPKIFSNIFNFLISPVIYKGEVKQDNTIADNDYKKIFDDSIQRGEKDKIRKNMANTLSEGVLSFGRRGRGDEAGLIDEDKKSVWLDDLEIKSNIDAANNSQVVQYTFTLRNREIVNEEAVIEFTLPPDNIITDLKLGPNLENQGQVAPRAAAANVYEQSLFRSIDPALLEMIGPRTYRLRVYPIPPVDGSGNRLGIELPDYEKVMFEFSGRASSYIPGIPYTKNLDLGTNYNTHLSVNVTGSLSSNQNLDLRNLTNNLSGKEIGIDRISLFSEKYQGCNLSNNSIDLFVDVSRSAKSKVDEYINFIDSLKSFGISKINLYEFNHQSNLVKNDLSIDEAKELVRKIDFWGYTDKSLIVNDLMDLDPNRMVFVLTDDSDFEFTNKVNYDVDYTKNSAKIFIVQGGDRLTAQKEEIVNLVLSNGGNSLLANFANSDLGDVVCQNQNYVNDYTVKGLLDNYKSNLSLIKNIYSSGSRIEAARSMNRVAAMNKFVDPLNSMIAVETTWQQNSLNNQSGDDDAFNQNFDIGEQNLGNGFLNGASMPEADGLIVIVMVAICGSIGIIFQRKLRRT